MADSGHQSNTTCLSVAAVAEVLMRLGDSHEAAGRPSRARVAWQEAWELFDGLGRPEVDMVGVRLGRLDPADGAPSL